MEKGKEVVYIKLLLSKSIDEQLLESPEIKKTTCTYASDEFYKFEVANRIKFCQHKNYGVIVYQSNPESDEEFVIFENLDVCNKFFKGFKCFFELKRLFREYQCHFSCDDIQSVLDLIKPICRKIKEGEMSYENKKI